MALLHTKVPSVFEETPESLTDVDFYFWRENFPKSRFERLSTSGRCPPWAPTWARCWCAPGRQWIPRKKLEESQVRVGNRVWLPFLRARRYMRSRQSLLDYSLTQLYRVAERYRG